MSGFASTLRNRHFWIVLVMLALCAFFHYFSPALPTGVDVPSSTGRQAVVRIIFLLPVVAAAFAFGRIGGLITLGLAAVLMLPRVLFVSPQPIDALLETAGILIVGYIIVWIIETQEREKRLRQQAVDELETVNAIALTLTQPYDLDAMLDKALSRALDAIGSERRRGAILLYDPWRQVFDLRAQIGLSPEFIERGSAISLSECLCGLTAESGEVLVVHDALDHPQHTRCPETEPHTHVCIPLKSKERLLGVMDFYLKPSHRVNAIDREMFGAIGRQIGVAVENARLCENLRFYLRQVTRAQEDERKRIARELHDDTAQRLIDISRRLDTLVITDEDLVASARERLEGLQKRIEETLQGVRRFSRDLRPSVLDDLGLLPAIEGLLTELQEDGIQTRIEIVGPQRRLSQDVELQLFRMVQEALSNAKRHAEATEVEIRVEFRDHGVRLSVRDNGRGFEKLGSTGDFALMGKFGLLGIEERAQLLRGQLSLLTGPNQGVIVAVEVPTNGLNGSDELDQEKNPVEQQLLDA